jgi:hypothetical protein
MDKRQSTGELQCDVDALNFKALSLDLWLRMWSASPALLQATETEKRLRRSLSGKLEQW